MRVRFIVEQLCDLSKNRDSLEFVPVFNPSPLLFSYCKLSHLNVSNLVPRAWGKGPGNEVV